MKIVRGLGLAFGFFAASFALHIAGGASDQGWLFAIAVALIYVAATGYPSFAALFSGASRGSFPRMVTVALGVPIGLALTVGALWAANDRGFAWWVFAAAPVLLLASSWLVEWVAGRVRPGRAGVAAA